MQQRIKWNCNVIAFILLHQGDPRKSESENFRVLLNKIKIFFYDSWQALKKLVTSDVPTYSEGTFTYLLNRMGIPAYILLTTSKDVM